jgi:predicted TIM-barrel fold metal-dependent hydrolase
VDHDEDHDTRLPIKIDSTSNGEFVPRPLPRINRLANDLAQSDLARHAQRTGQTRRAFLTTSAAAATTLAAFNQVNAAAGRRGGYYSVNEQAGYDNAAADQVVAGDEFIFDVQGHYVVPGSLAKTLKPKCRAADAALGRDYMRCLGADAFIKDIFLDSDTDMMVLSFIPSRRDAEPLTVVEAAATREIVQRLDGTQRLLIHGRVNPNQEGDLEDMDELAERWGVAAWKCYTQWGPDGRGFFLNDEATGIALIEKARRLGIRTVCVHKGIPFGRRSYEHSLCTDIGVVAARFPDVNFLVYHSGYIPGQPEGPYLPERGEGVDELIASVERNGLGPGSNVYAELGTTWRMLMRDPEQAAHCVGKLVKHLGADNVLYGSDCVWYGSPQDQIQAFRAFQISTEFQERFGYPQMTADLRARIFGLNGARVYGIDVAERGRRFKRDSVSRTRANYLADPAPHFDTLGPKTRREFLQLRRLQGGMPG